MNHTREPVTLETPDPAPARPLVNFHDLCGVDRLARLHKIDPQRVRQLRNAFYKKHRDVDEVARRVGSDAPSLEPVVEFQTLELAQRSDSRRDGATKLLLRTADDRLIESVILRMASGRTSLCVSTQVGCAAACRFCATGQMGLARNLSSAEILDQLAIANRLLAAENRVVRNLVFMGMGEPFHNETQLHAAIDVLTDSRAFDLHQRRIVVSTVGVPTAIVRLATRYPQIRLALSLHSARDLVRRELMPLARQHDLAPLRAAIEDVAAITRHPVMIEYLLLADVNDRPQDIEALVDYLRGLSVHVNLIPYNPIVESRVGESHVLRSSDPRRREAVASALKAAGFPVTTRYSLGADIEAACGQLVREQAGVVRRAVQRFS